MLRLHEYRYHRPSHLIEALDLLSRDDPMAIAGGTDLMPNMKPQLPRCSQGIDELRGIGFVDGEGRSVEEPGSRFLSIGACEMLTDIARGARVCRLFPSLARAAGEVAGPQIRNQATLGVATSA